jgi:hypothetical protein
MALGMFLTSRFCEFTLIRVRVIVKAFCDGYSANHSTTKVLGFKKTIIYV